MQWLLLILSLPTENATARMRAWRALKASGAAVLRDGVYVLPDRETCRATVERIAVDLREGGGTAHVLHAQELGDASFRALFDRGADYAELLADISRLRATLTADTASDVLKQTRKLRKASAALAAIDFFPGLAQPQADVALQDLDLAVARTLSPDEPHAVTDAVRRLRIEDYQNRTWATRRRPWVDRLASAWLIQRFIDPQVHLLWLASPADCPTDALGFDFDGASFTHVGARVTFEVLLASFGLDQAALQRLGALVHYLDVGGVQPAEASGVECVLAGLRDAITDDDELVCAACGVFDGLLATFEKDSRPK